MNAVSFLRKAALLNLLIGVLALLVTAQNDAVSEGMGALQRGDLPAAEQILRAELQSQPNNAAALDVLGVVLDNQKKYSEADEVYRRAIGLPGPTPALLNNYGNHLLAMGKPLGARAVFLKVVALNPGQVNAHIQLARISLEQKSAAAALKYLDQVSREGQQSTDVPILRMQALYLLHRDSEADAILGRLTSSTSNDAPLSFRLGQALSAASQYAKAETFFSRALEAAPTDPEVLHDLGIAASRAGHNERARDVLQGALQQQPANVEVLHDLAVVNLKLNQKEAALQELAQAIQLAPERADVQLLLARTTAELGYYGDAAQAWDRYTKLVPGDDAGRRERGFAQTALGINSKSAMEDLEWFEHKHPDDPMGHYELGMAVSDADPAKALAQFNRALSLKPDFTPALVARALLNYRQAKPDAALSDLEVAAKREPGNARILDRLGLTYLALDRPADAVRVLRKANDLAPRDSTTLIHLGHALTKAGDAQEANAVMARFRELGPNRSNVAHPAGLVNFLSLSPEEQYSQYRAGVERTVQKDPKNGAAQVQYLKVLLHDGRSDLVPGVAGQIIALTPGLDLLVEAANELLRAQQYETAKSFLDQSVAIGGAAGDLGLDLAIATFHVSSAKASLELMDRIPVAQRNGDYYLALVEMLAAAGRSAEAVTASQHAQFLNSSRPELFSGAGLALLKEHRPADALRLLEKATQVLLDDPEVLLVKAEALEAENRTSDAEKLLRDIENRWPEWDKVWLEHGTVLDAHGQYEQARQMLQTGISLGGQSAEAARLQTLLQQQPAAR